MSDDQTRPSRGRSASPSSGGKTSDLYATITQRMIDILEKGVVPWRSPIIRHDLGWPRNFNTERPYRGVNVFFLATTSHFMGYDSACWLTFRQAQAAGGCIRKGEKATMVVFFKPYEVTDRVSGEKKTVPLLRYFNVFNLSQCEGIAAPDAPPLNPVEFKPIEEAEKIVAGYADAPSIHHGGSRAFYRPTVDEVHLPSPDRFRSREEYYATLFHELAHSTGHSKRLDRGLDKELVPFGSPDYSKEELVAEMAAAFLCGHAGIQPIVIENQAAYLSGWLGKLKKDPKLLISAASAAQRADEWIRRPSEKLLQDDTGAEIDEPGTV